MRESKLLGKKSAVTPAIATMILLSGTLVLSLVVGAYTYGLMRPNVEKVLVTSILFYGGVSSDNSTISATSSITFALKNLGLPTNISSITLSGGSLSTPIISWSTTPNHQSGNSFLVGNNNKVPGGQTAFYTYYPVTISSGSILLGQTFEYIISLSNGQAISGSLLAQ